LKDKIIFKKNNILENKGITDKYYYTRFYKIPFCYIEQMITISNKFIDIKRGESIILDGKFLGLEEVLPIMIKEYIGPTFFTTVDKLGIEQNISVIPQESYAKFHTTRFI